MPYIGQQPTNVAFLTDQFSGNGSTTAFTLSAAPANTSSILVAISGVLQDPSTYSVSGTTLTFSPAPPTGTGNISVRFLGIPASGVTTTAYRTVTEFTATAGQTTFSVPSYTVGFIDVYRNGVMLGSADYTATSGVSVVLANGCTVGDLVEVISFQVSSVLNAIPASPSSVGTSYLVDGSVTTAKIADSAITTAKIAEGAVVTADLANSAVTTVKIADGAVTRAKMGYAGAVLQVQQSVLTSVFSSSSTGSWVSTGLSVSITPSSTSSRIFIMLQLSTGQSTSMWATSWGVARNGTPIGGGVSTSGAPANVWIATDSYVSDNQLFGLSMNFLDSPATTSAITYLVQYYGEGNTGYLNRSLNQGSSINQCSGSSTITVMEIAG
jgi:hypothetical protein